MKKLVTLVLPVCLLSLLACHKDSSKPPVTPPDSTTVGKLKINLENASSVIFGDTTLNNCELIISEPGGKVLLDTVMPPNAQLNTTLSTNATLVDVTTITFVSLTQRWGIITFKAVNPTTWTSDYNFPELAPNHYPKTVGQASLLYQHLPSYQSPVYLTFSQETSFSGQITEPAPNTALATYQNTPGNYAYLLCNDQLLYKLYLPKTSKDTVDCTTMDTAIGVNYNTSPNYSYQYTSLYGFTDSTNINTQLDIFYSFTDLITQNVVPYQLVYPNKYFQKYHLFSGFSNNNGEHVIYYTSSSKVSPTISYPDPNAYTLNSQSSSNFSVTFNTIKPAYYYTSWSDGNTDYNIYASPDSTTLNPAGIWTPLKSKLLPNKSLGDLVLKVFQYQIVPGYNYAGYVNLSCDSALLNNTELSSYTYYQKYF